MADDFHDLIRPCPYCGMEPRIRIADESDRDQPPDEPDDSYYEERARELAAIPTFEDLLTELDQLGVTKKLDERQRVALGEFVADFGRVQESLEESEHYRAQSVEWAEQRTRINKAAASAALELERLIQSMKGAKHNWFFHNAHLCIEMSEAAKRLVERVMAAQPARPRSESEPTDEEGRTHRQAIDAYRYRLMRLLIEDFGLPVTDAGDRTDKIASKYWGANLSGRASAMAWKRNPRNR